jgi:hypothetical protein
MPFEWINKFQRSLEKPDNYADKALAAYRLGMKAGGSIIGVRIVVENDCCPLARALPIGAIYHPDDAPHIPLSGCTLGHDCRCVYRPVMSYQDLEGGDHEAGDKT